MVKCAIYDYFMSSLHFQDSIKNLFIIYIKINLRCTDLSKQPRRNKRVKGCYKWKEKCCHTANVSTHLWLFLPSGSWNFLAKPRHYLSAQHLHCMSLSPGSALRELKPWAGEWSALCVQPAVGSGLPWWSKTCSEDKRTLTWACRVISVCTPWETSSGPHPEPVGGGRPAEPHLRLLGSLNGPCSFSHVKHWENIFLSNYPCRSGD